MKLYNTLTNQDDQITPHDSETIKMYNCGPTVYSDPHIGNFRSFLVADLLRRSLEYEGYNVQQIMNITDVGHLQQGQGDQGEDKMEVASRREQKTAWEIAEYYTEVFLNLLEQLNCKEADKYPKATEHVEEMIDHVQQLIENDHAYVVDGEVYYDITTFDEYGKLSDNTPDQLEAGKRIDVDPKKKNPWDFALWKQDPDHQMQWDSPWGKGFPGWHIECSTMATTYLGDQIDIHTGGEDNIFPHHEAEIAQTEGITGKSPYVQYWVHIRHLQVNGEKMSKSLGNFYTVRDVLQEGYEPETLRFALLNTHYRQNMDFSMQRMEECKKQIRKITRFRKKMREISKSNQENGSRTNLTERCRKAREEFQENLASDLNISGAMGRIFEFISDVNQVDPSASGAKNVLNLLDEWNDVLQILPESEEEDEELSSHLKKLIQQREEARQDGDYQKADEIRDQLREEGVLVKDTPDGPQWERIQ